MTKARRPAISIAPDLQADNSPTLSKGQRAFNALIKQIENRRKRLADWEAATVQFQGRYAGEFLPLERSRIALQIRLVRSLDQVYEHDAFTKAERRKISALIVDLAHDLIDEDPSLKTLYNKYSGTDFDREAALQAAEMKSRLESALGVDLGDDADVHSEEAVLQRARAHIEQRAEKKAAAASKREARRAARTKSPKQLAAEAREEDEQAQMSLSIREVYRKLASALHPDRETDPQERDRKTRLMQRVNEAYDKSNLLQLLELQLELEHIDQHSINRISEARLAHYNQILKDQVRELDRQIHRVETTFRYTYGYQRFEALPPDAVLQKLDLDIAALHQQVRNFEQDLAAFDDFRDVRRMLKSRTTLD
ncbi:J domain-containing protein [Ralstonia pickettii]|uniref:J domain-containing protein n=1 Tax=Ralstonia pickettii TaxID=329 RepID=UPI00081895A0|nr:J domain-containing protein [Ralstonia pickettii]OCS49236.1 molecular chaperone DnaJ [Ralstonia pickettii]